MTIPGALLERGQALRERLKSSGLGHLYKGWNGKPEVQQAGPASSSSTVAESDPAPERRLELKDIDTIEDKWLRFSHLLPGKQSASSCTFLKCSDLVIFQAAGLFAGTSYSQWDILHPTLYFTASS